jgi:hypothetical protein
MASYAALQREAAAVDAGTELSAAKREADAIKQQNPALAQRLGAADALTPLSAAPRVAGSPDEILRCSLGAAPSAVQCACEGPADSLTLDYRQAASDGLYHRLAAAAVLAVLLALGIVGFGRGKLTQTLRRWPHATAAVLGLAWWWWLSPSVLGLGIVLLSALAAAYSAFAFDTKSCQKSRALR